MTDTQLIDHETKQALLSAISHRAQELVEQANRHLEYAAAAEEAGDTALAISHRRVADQDGERASVLRHLWNDAKPVDVRVQLTRGSR
jgi:hypothetical protein